MSSDPSASSTVAVLPRNPWVRLAQITGVFVVLGPVLAACIALIMLSAFAMVGSEAGFLSTLGGYGRLVSVEALGQLYGWPFLAVLPGLATGAFFGWHQGWRGHVPFAGAVMAGGGIGALYFLVSDFFGWGAGQFGASFSVVSAAGAVLILYPILSWIGRGDRHVV